MKIKNIWIISLLYFPSHPTLACINSYAFEMGQQQFTQKSATQQLSQHNRKFKTIEEQNDYGVLLIYAHQYEKAIQVFSQIETLKPNLPKTAANLGTAYELAGHIDSAKYWIERGIKRDPNIHEGSEWIHLKILEASVQQKKDPKWIQRNDVLGLNFGQKNFPIPYVTHVQYKTHQYDLKKILEHSKIQMDQRLKFVNKDPISAQIIFNMANIELLTLNSDVQIASTLYKRSSWYGFTQTELLKKRLAYAQHTSWYMMLWDNFKARLIALFS